MRRALATIVLAAFASCGALPALAQSPSLIGMPQASDPACSTGEFWIYASSATNVWKKCENGTISDLDTGGGGGGAPTTGDYLVGTANGSLSAEIVVGTTPGGELGGTWPSPTIDDTLTVDGWTLTNVAALTCSDCIALGGETLGNYVATVATAGLLSGGAAGSEGTAISLTTSMATSRIVGRLTAGTGVMEELTGTQATTLLDVFTSGLKGLAPASGGGTTNFLRADGTWAAPPGGAPGGSTTQVQFNNAGAFGGSSLLTWVSPTLTIGDGTTQGFLDVKCPTPGSMECVTTHVEDTAMTSPSAGARKMQARSDGWYERSSAGVERQFVMTTMAEAAAPATPPAGFVALYAKNSATAEFCSKDDAGTETCMSAGSGGGGGNSVEVTLDFGAGGAADASAVVTGQTWVASASEIVCAPTLAATADRVEGTEDAVLEGLTVAAHTRVAGTGFTLTGAVREGLAFGQYAVHCVGV